MLEPEFWVLWTGSDFPQDRAVAFDVHAALEGGMFLEHLNLPLHNKKLTVSNPHNDIKRLPLFQSPD